MASEEGQASVNQVHGMAAHIMRRDACKAVFVMVKAPLGVWTGGSGVVWVFRDDRVMSILSGVILMVAIGTVVQNSDTLSKMFAGDAGGDPKLVPDEAIARAQDLSRIDVLANDESIGETPEVVLVQAPRCGRVFVQGATLQYLPDTACLGIQSLSYTIAGLDLPPADVVIRVTASDLTSGPAAAAAGGPSNTTSRPAGDPAPVADTPTVSAEPALAEPAIAAAPDPMRPAEPPAEPAAGSTDKAAPAIATRPEATAVLASGGPQEQPAVAAVADAPVAVPGAVAIAPGSAPAAPAAPSAAAPAEPILAAVAPSVPAGPSLTAAEPTAPAEDAGSATRPTSVAEPQRTGRPAMPDPVQPAAGGESDLAVVRGNGSGALARPAAPSVPGALGTSGVGASVPEPVLAERPAAPGQTTAPGAPRPRGGDEPLLALSQPSTAPTFQSAPGRISDAPDSAIGAAGPTLPEPVEPRTDLAALTAPAEPVLVDDLGRLIKAPVPSSKPEARPVYTPEELAAAEAEAELPETAFTVPGAARPTAGAAPAAPLDPSALGGDGAFAGLGQSAGPAAAVPSAPGGLGAPAEPTLAAAVAPARSDSDPLGQATDEPVLGFNLLDLATLDPDDEVRSEIVALDAPFAAGDRRSPAALGGGMTPTLSLARIEVPMPSAEPAPAPEVTLDPGAAVTAVERPVVPSEPSDSGSRIALVQPSSGLGPVLELGDALTLTPVDLEEPPLLAEPSVEATDSDAVETAALGVAAGEPRPDPEQQAPAPQPAEQVAALPRAEEACTVPAGLTLDVGPAAVTTLHVSSPCHAGKVAALTYGELTLAIPIGDDGKGRIDVLGFESSMQGELKLPDGTRLDFTLPFEDVEKVERVALVWDQPVHLELHAFEFGAGAGDAGHVSAVAPRDYEAVRRTGGGFLTAYAPADGVGERAQVYTHFLRRGGDTGIVQMMIDFVDRREAAEGTCGDGELAQPGFTVVRASRGLAERPLRRRLAALDCALVETDGGRMITNAVKNMVITYK